MIWIAARIRRRYKMRFHSQPDCERRKTFRLHLLYTPVNLKGPDNMNRKSKLVFGAMGALLCTLCTSNGAFGQTLPDSKGKSEFVRICTACHGVDTAAGLRQDKDGWTSTVYEMVQRGADGSEEDLNNVILYLTTNFGPEPADPAAAPQPAAPSSTSGGPMALNVSGIQRVKRVIAESGSLKCPHIEQQGAHSGQALNAMGTRHTTNAIQTAIVSPHPTRNSLARYLGSLPSADYSAH
jgi:hypothetical protein